MTAATRPITAWRALGLSIRETVIKVTPQHNHLEPP